MGIKTVAIYSESDRFAKHVQLADESVLIHNQSSLSSYQNMNEIVRICKENHVDAVHPGYGLLSENWQLAALLQKNHILWCGPHPSCIQRIKNKIETKQHVSQYTLNLIPGLSRPLREDDNIPYLCRQIGYPVMFKSIYSSDGHGIHIAYNDHDSLAAYHICQQESMYTYGTNEVFIEKYIENPRHIEIQVLADKYGHLCFFPERECSIQRNYHKVVEESPSIFMTDAMRDFVCTQIDLIAKSLHYYSTGSIEILYDQQRTPYFLGMNASIPVEYLLTEAVTGINVIEEMFWIEAGRPLTLPQSPSILPHSGHALECKIYNEDPYHYFLPVYGQILKYKEPTGPHTRCESGVVEGSMISLNNDPLLSKLVTWGETREEAIHRMEIALSSYIIRGIQTNIDFLYSIVRSSLFQKGIINTSFVKREWPCSWKPHQLNEHEMDEVVASSFYLYLKEKESQSSFIKNLQSTTIQKYKMTMNNHHYSIECIYNESSHQYFSLIDGKTFILYHGQLTNSRTTFEAYINNKPICIHYLKPLVDGYQVSYHGNTFNVEIYTRKEYEYLHKIVKQKHQCICHHLYSPMEGQLTNLKVKLGEVLYEGQYIGSIEAMKMESELYAPRDCSVTAIHKKIGDIVSMNDTIIEFK